MKEVFSNYHSKPSMRPSTSLWAFCVLCKYLCTVPTSSSQYEKTIVMVEVISFVATIHIDRETVVSEI